MLDRLGKIIINAQIIDPNQKANIEVWLERARENTRYTSEYLRHTFYAEIERTGTNGFTNAAFGLGEGESCDIKFSDSNGLWLALNNHYLLILCVVLVTRAIPANDLPNLRDELHLMTEFAKLSFFAKRRFTMPNISFEAGGKTFQSRS
jgi:hypothetical protein